MPDTLPGATNATASRPEPPYYAGPVQDGAHVIERHRLVERLAPAPLVVLEAPSGYGKSTVADELTAGQQRISVGLSEGDPTLGRLAARMADAAAQAGDHVAAEAAVGDGEADTRVGRFLVAALASGGALVIDDVHHLDDAAMQALAEMISSTPRSPLARSIVIGRRVSHRPTGAVLVDDQELAFDRDEIREVLSARGTAAADDDIALCRRATGGWPAAVSMWGLRPAGDPSRGSVAVLVGELLARLPRDRSAVLQSAPLLSPDLGALVGWPTIITDLQREGFPLRLVDGWWVLGDVVRDHLRGVNRIDPAHAAGIARHYAEGGRFLHAVDVMLAAGAPAELARILAGADLELLEQADLQELAGVLESLPSEAVAQAPECLLTLAWAASARVQIAIRRRALDRLERFTADRPRLARQVEVERVYDLSRDAQMDEAEARGSAVLALLEPDEVTSRVRCLYALGETATIRGDPSSLVHASAFLGESAGLARTAGLDLARAKALNTLAYSVHFSRAEFAQALARTEEAVSLARRGTRFYGTLLTFSAEIMQFLGRDADALDTLAEARQIARRFGDVRTIAYCAWATAKVFARQRDVAGVQQWLAEADSHRAEWFDHPTGAEFLAGGAELNALAGDTKAARAWLARAEQHPAVEEYPDIVWPAMGSVEARDGDPAAAVQILTRLLEEGWTEYRERWHYRLWIAYALWRAGDAAAAAAEFRRACAECATFGQPDFPWLHEPEMCRALSLAPTHDATGPIQIRVHVLGGFSVSAGGDNVAIAPGKPQQLVKILALAGRALPDDEVCDLLWPDATQEVGRRRLRNVVARVRAAGPLLDRTEGLMALAAGITVDLTDFEGLARTALRAADEHRRERASAALALYGGELLPGDRFEDWAASARERVRVLAVQLMEVVVDDAEAAGRVDEAVAAIEQLLATDPYADRWADRAGGMLAAAGRAASAAAWSDRAHRIRAELGLS